MNIMLRVTHSCPLSSPGSLLLSIPVAVYQRLEAGYWFGPQTYCSEVFPSACLQRAFIIYSFLAVYLLPLLTITACYAFMLKRMGQSSVNPIDSSYQVRGIMELLFYFTIIKSIENRMYLKLLNSSFRLKQSEQHQCGRESPGWW